MTRHRRPGLPREPQMTVGVILPTREVLRLDRIAHSQGIGRAELFRRAVLATHPPDRRERPQTSQGPTGPISEKNGGPCLERKESPE